MPARQASIIIVAYNSAAYIDDCLASLYQDVNFEENEIIVLDNASTDSSFDRVQDKWRHVRVIRNKINTGFVAACNQGAQFATGQFLVFLNPDTRVLPGWLDGLLNEIKFDKTSLPTSKALLMSQPDKIQACGTDMHYTGLQQGRGFLEPASNHTETKTVGAVCGVSFAVHRDIWAKLGGFEPLLFMYNDDTELSWRAQLAGLRCVYVPTSQVYHDLKFRQSGTALYYGICGRYLMLLKNWRWPTLVLLSPALLLAELVNWGFMLMVGWSGIHAKLRAYGWLVFNFFRVLHLRSKSQSIRQVSDWIILQNRAWKLTPRLRTGGTLGEWMIQLANMFFVANGWLAFQICRLLGW